MKKTELVLTLAVAMTILFLPTLSHAVATCEGSCGPQTVPEPAVFTLLASGIGAIGALRYFRKK